MAGFDDDCRGVDTVLERTLPSLMRNYGLRFASIASISSMIVFILAMSAW